MLQLEAMVDRAGISNVLYALKHICWAKGDHIQGDLTTSNHWHLVGSALHKIADITHSRLPTGLERRGIEWQPMQTPDTAKQSSSSRTNQRRGR
jgi:hypothetical protein